VRVVFSLTSNQGFTFPPSTAPFVLNSAAAWSAKAVASAYERNRGASDGLKCSGGSDPTMARQTAAAASLTSSGTASGSGRPSTRGIRCYWFNRGIGS
jgi:hypothetical protein